MMLCTPQKLLWRNTIAFSWCYRIHEIPTYRSHLTGPCPVVIYDHMVTASTGEEKKESLLSDGNFLITRAKHIVCSWNPPLIGVSLTWKIPDLLDKRSIIAAMNEFPLKDNDLTQVASFSVHWIAANISIWN